MQSGQWLLRFLLEQLHNESTIIVLVRQVTTSFISSLASSHPLISQLFKCQTAADADIIPFINPWTDGPIITLILYPYIKDTRSMSVLCVSLKPCELSLI